MYRTAWYDIFRTIIQSAISFCLQFVSKSEGVLFSELITLWVEQLNECTGDDYAKCCDEWKRAGGDPGTIPSRYKVDDSANANKLYEAKWEGASLVDERQSRVGGLASKFKPHYPSE